MERERRERLIRAAIILAASLAAAGLATSSPAQDDPDEEYWSINEEPGPWYLQRSTCTLAHNATDRAEKERDRGVVVVWFRTGGGAEIAFRDRNSRDRIRDGQPVRLNVTVDGAARPVLGAQGQRFENGRGYRIFAEEAMLDAIAAGRRLEFRRGGRPVLLLDLAGAGPAIAALRACQAEAEEPAPAQSRIV